MIKFIGCVLSCAVLLIQASSVQAAEVEVKWSNPDKYRDIDAAQGHRKHFRERLFKSLEKHFAKVASSLPEQQKLMLDFTDIDLAGDVDFSGTKRVRIIKELYSPRLEFSYQLLDADKSVIKTAEVSLKDMGFLMSSGLRYQSKSFGYEKEMFDDWFKKTFANEIVK